MKCTLPIDVNNCPFCNKQNMTCMNENNCTFQDKNRASVNKTYTREERWYEKYYRKK